MSKVSVLLGLNVTSHFLDQLVIVSRSLLMVSDALSGVSTIKYKLVSSANRRMLEFMSVTMSLM